MANITRYNPFNEVVSLREAMDHLFEDSFIPRIGSTGRGTASNLYETAEGFVLQIPLAGVNPEDVDITVQPNQLNLKWETKTQIPEGTTTHWSGFQAGQYQQSFTLPTAINTDRVEAGFQNGMLMVNLPKAEHAKARTVKVSAKNKVFG